MTERFSREVSFNFINVFNHNQFLDPSLNIVGNPTLSWTGIWPVLHGGNFAANDGVRNSRAVLRSIDQSAAFESSLTAKGRSKQARAFGLRLHGSLANQGLTTNFRVGRGKPILRLVARSYSEVKLSVPIQDFARTFRLLL